MDALLQAHVLRARWAHGILSGCADETLQRLNDGAFWFSLPGGEMLYTAGEPADGVYLILSGRLVIVRPDPDGAGPESERIIGYCRAGDPLGEMSILNDDVHGADAVALRDCEMLKIPHALFDDLLIKDARFAAAIGRVIAHRARFPNASFQKSGPRVFALVASSPSISIESFAEEIATHARAVGKRCVILCERDLAKSTYEIEALEEEADLLLLACNIGDAPLYRFALRHADRFFVFARRDARPPNPLPLSPTPDSPARRFRLVDLVMIQEGQATGSVADWAAAVDAARIFHWGPQHSANRLARALSGLSVGLVLSGGGARAYAHVGALCAMRERGVPIDFVAGASMGAIVGACIAMGWSNEEIDARVQESFVVSNPLADHVLPVVALTKGHIVEERLERQFGDTLIEEMPLPFQCVSTDLTAGGPYVHRRGLLREALRASISLPGVLPPVVIDDSVLVDGAVVNNFPIDLMKNLHRGATIGVDVARKGSFSADPYHAPPGFFSWVRQNGLRAAPPIVSLLMRVATTRIECEPGHPTPDILITPELDDIELRDWRKYDAAVAEGRAEMADALDGAEDLIAEIVNAATGPMSC